MEGTVTDATESTDPNTTLGQNPLTQSSIHIGCSGWNYRHWRGAFYPDGLRPKDWFGYYAEHFDTVEINNSFYRLPKSETFDAWRDQAPAGFRYAVKANRYLTQAKKLKDCQEPLDRMIEPTRHLGATLGPILYQLPPSLRLNLRRLEDFLKLLPSDLRHVVEFRHDSWYIDEVRRLLDRFKVGFVAHDFPGVPSPRWVCGAIAYARFHGAEGKYFGRYSPAALEDWGDWLWTQASLEQPAWAYFNNDIDGAAIADALALRTVVQRKAAAKGGSRSPSPASTSARGRPKNC